MAIRQRRTGDVIVQERAEKTRTKLLISDLEMYSKKGYAKTTVDDIAGNAGLSVGVAYRYFKNKKDILLSSMEYAFLNMEEISGTNVEDLVSGDIRKILEKFESLHEGNKALHEELESLRHSDKDVGDLYRTFTSEALSKIHGKLGESISYEDLVMAVDMMECFCHHRISGDLDEDSLNRLREKTARTVSGLLDRSSV